MLLDFKTTRLDEHTIICYLLMYRSNIPHFLCSFVKLKVRAGD